MALTLLGNTSWDIDELLVLRVLRGVCFATAGSSWPAGGTSRRGSTVPATTPGSLRSKRSSATTCTASGSRRTATHGTAEFGDPSSNQSHCGNGPDDDAGTGRCVRSLDGPAVALGRRVQDAIAEALEAEGLNVTETANTETKAPGIDPVATKDQRWLAVGVKGYPNTVAGRWGRRPRITVPTISGS